MLMSKSFATCYKTAYPMLDKPVHQRPTKTVSSVSACCFSALRKRRNWTNIVTDVRNWLDFSASELYRENDTQKNYYSDSSGKSGGQKAKLAYTILASAIAYQYGLDQESGTRTHFPFCGGG